MSAKLFRVYGEAKEHADRLYRRGFEVDIQKRSNGYAVKAKSPRQPRTHRQGRRPAGQPFVDKRMLKKSISRRLRRPADLTFGDESRDPLSLNPLLYDPTKGGQRARIAQEPRTGGF